MTLTKEDLKNLGALLGKQKKDIVQELDTQFAYVNKQLKSQSSATESMKIYMETQFRAIESRFDKLEGIYPTREEFQQLQDEVAELRQKVNTLLSSTRH